MQLTKHHGQIGSAVSPKDVRRKTLGAGRTADGKLVRERLISRSHHKLGLFSTRRMLKLEAMKKTKFTKLRKASHKELIQVTAFNLITSSTISLFPIVIRMFDDDANKPWGGIEVFILVLQFIISAPTLVTVRSINTERKERG